jgi:DNA primase
MTNWIDFKELRKQLDFGRVLQHYGVTLKISGAQHHGFCPLPSHNGKKNSPSFSANLKRGIWQCFGCGEKGNVIDFAVLMERANPKNGEDVQRVAAQLQDHFVHCSSHAAKPVEEPKENDNGNIVINAPLNFELKGLCPDHPYLLNRGFTPETIENFGLGYCARGLLQNRIAIPLRNREGKLVGYAGRVIDDDSITEENPKYKFPGKRRRKNTIYEFRKSFLLYAGRSFWNPVDDLIVVEGFAGVWWLRQTGIVNVVAVMGSACSEVQAELIVSLVSEKGCVWIMTDGDQAGEHCAGEIFARVAPHRSVRWAKLKSGEQPTDIGKKHLNELLPFAEL